MQSNDTENAPAVMLAVDDASLAKAEADLEKDALASKHIFARCQRKPEIRELFKRVGFFYRLRDDKGEQPINTSYQNLVSQLDTYHRIERFGVENKMALRGVTESDVKQAQAFRATYAHMVADRIYEAVPYGRVYFHMIMAYYAVSRMNFDRIAQIQVVSLFAGLLISIGAGYLLFVQGVHAQNVLLSSIVSGVVLGFVYSILNQTAHAFYKNAVDLNTTAIADKIRERIFHLITAEQACFSRITTEENSAGSDSLWRERAGVWAIAAVAYRWRVFLLKQFLDVGTHLTTRHYLWLHKFQLVFCLSAIVFVTYAWFLATAFGVTPQWLRAAGMFAFLNGQEFAQFISISMLPLIVLWRFFWSANPAHSINQIAARIGTADAGIGVDTPIDMIVHLVGRVSTAKNEGRRN